MADVKSDRRRALELAITAIDRRFGQGRHHAAGAGGVFDGMRRHPHRSLALDMALGIGGVPRGRVIEVVDRNPGARPPSPCISSPRRRDRRHSRLHRRGAVLDPVRQAAGRRPESCSSPSLTPVSRHQDRRDAGPIERGGRHRHRLGGRPGAALRGRRRNRRFAGRPTGAAHVPGTAK